MRAERGRVPASERVAAVGAKPPGLTNDRVVPVDIVLIPPTRVLVITGPNTVARRSR